MSYLARKLQENYEFASFSVLQYNRVMPGEVI